MPDDTFRSTRPLWLFEHGQRKQANGSMLDTRPTIGNVSRIAGVLLGTASKAFANRALVHNHLRGRVKSASLLLSYHPNDIEASRPTSRTMVMSILDLAIFFVAYLLQAPESASEVDAVHGV
jgi:DNA-binding LacI/PurR family transcriptional regulator